MRWVGRTYSGWRVILPLDGRDVRILGIDGSPLGRHSTGLLHTTGRRPYLESPAVAVGDRLPAAMGKIPRSEECPGEWIFIEQGAERVRHFGTLESVTPLSGHLCRVSEAWIGTFWHLPFRLAGMSRKPILPTNCDRSRPTCRRSRPGPALPVPDPPRDGQIADCGESAPQSRRSWHQTPSRPESAVPTAGAPAGWSKNSPHDEAVN